MNERYFKDKYPIWQLDKNVEHFRIIAENMRKESDTWNNNSRSFAIDYLIDRILFLESEKGEKK